MNNNPYQKAYIEISGKCNARCPWCDRGARILGFLEPPLKNDAPVFMPPDTFGEILDHALEHNIISPNAQINLHNWGEPLIHPQIDEIFLILRNNTFFKGSVTFSTNASRRLELNPDRMPKIHLVIFSMPGFSQKSYDFAHKFNFEKITANMLAMAKDLQRFPHAVKQIVYHLYKHNLLEIKGAQLFSKKLNFEFIPSLAFFNSKEYAFAYYNQTLAPEILQMAQKSLFLFDKDELKYLRPKDFTCPQCNVLVISHDAQLNVGCCARLNEASDCLLGDIRQLSLDDILRIRKKAIMCHECVKAGLDFMADYCTKVRQPAIQALVKKYGL